MGIQKWQLANNSHLLRHNKKYITNVLDPITTTQTLLYRHGEAVLHTPTNRGCDAEHDPHILYRQLRVVRELVISHIALNTTSVNPSLVIFPKLLKFCTEMICELDIHYALFYLFYGFSKGFSSCLLLIPN